MDEDKRASYSKAAMLPVDDEAAAWRPIFPERVEFTIGEVARELGITQRALRFYEGMGLLAPRRQGAARLYSRCERQRLALVLKAKSLGFTLSEIRPMLAAPQQPNEAAALNISRRQCFEQIKLLEQRKREIELALAQLRCTYSSFYARIAAATV